MPAIPDMFPRYRNTSRRIRPDRRLPIAFALAIACCCMSGYAFTDLQQHAPDPSADGINPHPVELRLPPVRPLSAVAQLGKALFFDTSLSASGRQSCASCHDPEYGYNPPPGRVLQPGGAHLEQVGNRPPPSLAYLYRQAPFSIGPDPADADIPVNLNALAASSRSDPRAQKTAGNAPAATPMVPQGGLFWDGRADSLQRQALVPMLNPVEMANPSIASVARKLARRPHRKQFAQLFGPGIFNDPRQLVSEAMFAIGRFEIEDPSFHAFTSKYDAWLQGRARLTSDEMRGLELFNDSKKGNCAACHLSQPGRDGNSTTCRITPA